MNDGKWMCLRAIGIRGSLIGKVLRFYRLGLRRIVMFYAV
jgi:hypothetical protein